ncbi:MAG: serine protease [bacterium]|nr:serine protease [bacterium]
MPGRHAIQDEITTAPDRVRRRYLAELAQYTGRDTIVYASAFSGGGLPFIPSEVVSINLDDVPGFMAALQGLQGDSLDIILHSPGGYMEAAEQIVMYLRQKYKNMRAIVPQNAMSAATMIACACDSIVMAKHSALGPIDPQISIPTPNGNFSLPAQAILDEFELAKQEVDQAVQSNDQATIMLWLSKVQQYPPGILRQCEVALQYSKQKVAEWLSQYMFHGEPNSRDKSSQIATWLGDANVHKTHGRPISAEEAQRKGLKVQMLEDDQQLQDKVLSVFHATLITFQVTNCVKMVENHLGKGVYIQAQVLGMPVPGVAPSPPQM